MKNSSLSDVVEGCIRGKEAAMKTFYERFYGYAMAVCMAYSNNREDACEMLNDGFLKAFKGLKHLKNEEALLPWLRQIMVHTALDCFRRNQRRRGEISSDEIVREPAEPYQNEEGVLAQLSAEEILKHLQQLPPAPRMVFGLYVLEGYSHQEIAHQLKIAESSSRSYLNEANKRLRKLLTVQNEKSNERFGR
ncbi:MAG: RNA polymerase sigma factor [Spirosomataceae bacterium]